MFFAKKQNLINKTGVRFSFKEADIFETLEFNDNFAVAPNSMEKAAVLGIQGKFDIKLYDLEEVENTIKNLSKTYKAKAYDVVYKDYAELIVDDEMGYFNPNFIGTIYKPKIVLMENMKQIVVLLIKMLLFLEQKCGKKANV